METINNIELLEEPISDLDAAVIALQLMAKAGSILL